MKRKAAPRKASKARQERVEEIAELVSDKAARKYERALNKYVMELDEKAEERENYTKGILAVNDDSVEEVVGHIVESLRRMNGEPVITFEGRSVNAVKGEGELIKSIQTRNFRWIAVRLLVASALWDIRIGNFELPDNKCARCLKPVVTPRKKVKR